MMSKFCADQKGTYDVKVNLQEPVRYLPTRPSYEICAQHRGGALRSFQLSRGTLP